MTQYILGRRIPRMEEIWEVAAARGANSEWPGAWRDIRAAWPCQEGMGNILHEVVYGFNASGFLMDGTNWSREAGLLGIEFNGTDEFMRVDRWPYQPVNKLSFSMWAYGGATMATFDSPIGNTTSAFSPGWGLYYDLGNGTKFWMQGYTSNVATGGFTLGRWEHQCGTWDGSTIQIYRDGNPGISDSFTGSIVNNDALRIGTTVGAAARNWPGILSNIVIWNRGLNVNEVRRQYYDPWAMWRKQRVYWAFKSPTAAPAAETNFLTLLGVG